MPQLEESERITEVQLWLYVAPISSTPFFHLKIEEIVDSDTEINSRVILIDDSAAAWQSITITPWYQTQDSLLADAGDLGGLKIFRVSCLGCSSTPEFTLGFNDSKKPYLEVNFLAH